MDSQDPPFRPKLRPLDVRPILHEGRPYFVLRDPVGLNGTQVLVPQALGPLLALCDGTRAVDRLGPAYELQTGVRLPAERISGFIGHLGDSLLLDDHRYAAAINEATAAYREAPFRPPALAGKVYPDDPDLLGDTLQGYCEQVGPALGAAARPVAGIVTPHIDYARGHRVYAQVWRPAAEAVRDAEVIVVFGTDHSGGPGRLTLTRQDYATPWGPLTTRCSLVDRLASELGEGVFDEEIHHKEEHSVELALVWAHYFLGGRDCEVLPVLCGSFHNFVEGGDDPDLFQSFETALTVLSEELQGKRTLIVAAADLAHVGPAFGDAAPYSELDRGTLRRADEGLMRAVEAGDAPGFFRSIQEERDSRRICGMPPIYLTLRMLQGAIGETTGYDQCGADPAGGSLVSIMGALLRR